MAYVQIILLLALALGVCVFAFVWGQMAERLAAAIVISSVPVGFLVALLPREQQSVAELLADGVMAFLILALALRFPTRWLGTVLILYAAQFSLHAFYFVTSRPRDEFHLIANNLIFLAVNVTLLMGAGGTVRHRAAERLQAA